MKKQLLFLALFSCGVASAQNTTPTSAQRLTETKKATPTAVEKTKVTPVLKRKQEVNKKYVVRPAQLKAISRKTNVESKN